MLTKEETKFALGERMLVPNDHPFFFFQTDINHFLGYASVHLIGHVEMRSRAVLEKVFLPSAFLGLLLSVKHPETILK